MPNVLGPCCLTVRLMPSAARVRASSQVAGRSLPPSRTRGSVSRGRRGLPFPFERMGRTLLGSLHGWPVQPGPARSFHRARMPAITSPCAAGGLTPPVQLEEETRSTLLWGGRAHVANGSGGVGGVSGGLERVLHLRPGARLRRRLPHRRGRADRHPVGSAHGERRAGYCAGGEGHLRLG